MEKFIPNTYKALDYIQNNSSGTAYIDTGILYSADLITAELYIGAASYPSGYSTVFGMYTASSNGTPFSIWFGTSSSSSGLYDHTSRVTYPFAALNGMQKITVTNNKRAGTAYNLFLFKANPKGGSSYAGSPNLRVYGCKIFINNKLVQNLKPVKRVSDGILGMYDLESDTFLSNSGTGNFVQGNEIQNSGLLSNIFYFGNKFIGFEKNNYVYSNESSYYWGNPGTVTIGDTLYVQSDMDSRGRGAKCVSSTPIDLTHINTLYFDINTFSGDGIHSCTVIKNKDDYSNGSVGPVARVAFSKIGEYSIDVSSLSGDYYISLSCMSNLNSNRNYMSCNRIYTDLYSVINWESGASLGSELNDDCTYTIFCSTSKGYTPNGFYKGSTLVERNTPLLNYSVVDNSTVTLKTITSNQAVLL